MLGLSSERRLGKRGKGRTFQAREAHVQWPYGRWQLVGGQEYEVPPTTCKLPGFSATSQDHSQLTWGPEKSRALGTLLSFIFHLLRLFLLTWTPDSFIRLRRKAAEEEGPQAAPLLSCWGNRGQRRQATCQRRPSPRPGTTPIELRFCLRRTNFLPARKRAGHSRSLALYQA